VTARRRDVCQQALPSLDFSLVQAEDLQPITSEVRAGILNLTKGGAVLILAKAFIDGVHILMDVHNITHKLAQITLPTEGGEAPEGLRLWGEVVRFNRLEGEESPCFLVELDFIRDKPVKESRQRTMKRLTRLAKAQPAPE
jgi:hypothetical protein